MNYFPVIIHYCTLNYFGVEIVSDLASVSLFNLALEFLRHL